MLEYGRENQNTPNFGTTSLTYTYKFFSNQSVT